MSASSASPASPAAAPRPALGGTTLVVDARGTRGWVLIKKKTARRGSLRGLAASAASAVRRRPSLHAAMPWQQRDGRMAQRGSADGFGEGEGGGKGGGRGPG